MEPNVVITIPTTNRLRMCHQDHLVVVQVEDQFRVPMGPAVKTILHPASNSLSLRALAKSMTDSTTLIQNLSMKHPSSCTLLSQILEFRVTNASGGSGLTADGGLVHAKMLEQTKALHSLMLMYLVLIRKRSAGRILNLENTLPTSATTALRGASISMMERPFVEPRLRLRCRRQPRMGKMPSL